MDFSWAKLCRHMTGEITFRYQGSFFIDKILGMKKWGLHLLLFPWSLSMGVFFPNGLRRLVAISEFHFIWPCCSAVQTNAYYLAIFGSEFWRYDLLPTQYGGGLETLDLVPFTRRALTSKQLFNNWKRWISRPLGGAMHASIRKLWLYHLAIFVTVATAALAKCAKFCVLQTVFIESL